MFFSSVHFSDTQNSQEIKDSSTIQLFCLLLKRKKKKSRGWGGRKEQRRQEIRQANNDAAKNKLIAGMLHKQPHHPLLQPREEAVL